MYMHAHMCVCNMCIGGRVTMHVYVDVCVLATGQSLNTFFLSFLLRWAFSLELAK